MENRSRRVISVLPCTLEDAERNHLRIRVVGSEKEAHLELIKVKQDECLMGARKNSRGGGQRAPEDPRVEKGPRKETGS